VAVLRSNYNIKPPLLEILPASPVLVYNWQVLQVILSVTAISLIPVLVGLLSSSIPAVKTKLLPFFVSFAAGVMLGNTFFDLLPESLEGFGSSDVMFAALLGIVFFYLMEKYLLWHSHTYKAPRNKNTSLLVMLGDTLHNFIDGIVIAGAFLASPLLGLTTALSIALHEIPQEIADFSILLESGYKPKKAILFNFISGLVALIGAVGGYMFLSIAVLAVPYFMAFAGGMFIYIACSDLIPKTHEWDKVDFSVSKVIWFIGGIASIKLLSGLIG